MTDNERQSPDEIDVTGLLGPMEVLKIQQGGRAAALGGMHVKDCPFPVSDDPETMARQKMWIRGYAMGRTELRQTRRSPRQSPKLTSENTPQE